MLRSHFQFGSPLPAVSNWDFSPSEILNLKPTITLSDADIIPLRPYILLKRPNLTLCIHSYCLLHLRQTGALNPAHVIPIETALSLHNP